MDSIWVCQSQEAALPPPLWPCFLLLLPEAPGNTGMGSREKVTPVRTGKVPVPPYRAPAQPQSPEVSSFVSRNPAF